MSYGYIFGDTKGGSLEIVPVYGNYHFSR